ncbi:hypothetical protein AGMMS49938_10080 [Fibrobacterales bacterium]|nr:hypothetical protein AGMMS49938_10080 [Fibrobacterales bacterium]
MFGKVMKKFLAITFFILALQQFVYAATPTVWQNGEFYIWNYGQPFASPNDLCFFLRYENEKIGNPQCYNAGDWERDTIAANYAKWLNKNLDTRLAASDLKPRNQHISKRLGELKDKSLIFSSIRNDTLWLLLFTETANEPQKIANFPLIVYPNKADSTEILKKIANDWFGKSPQIRLTDSEREQMAKEPDAYFAKQPQNDFWFGISAGLNRAKIPLTPNSWYKNKLNSKVKNYREPTNNDSNSAWSFIKDDTPLFTAYIGGSIYDFIGLEFGVRYSSHNVKVDNSQTIYDNLDYWYFNRYEFMLEFELMHSFLPHKYVEIKPHASFDVLYSILSENISLKDETIHSAGTDYYYNNRFQFENYYRGVSLTLGVRTAIFTNYAIDIRTGLVYRGRSNVIVPSGDAAPEPTVIGNSTTDGFISAGLEYHIKWE